jgi:hypothetical protein
MKEKNVNGKHIEKQKKCKWKTYRKPIVRVLSLENNLPKF